MHVRRRDLVGKFFADRGPHLAAMIAYFALLSFVPLTFLSLSALGLTGRADESSFLVREIKKTLPGAPIDRIVDLVHSVQDNAATLGVIGGLALLWTSLSLFSVLESAFNIVYGQPNRSFLRGKLLAVALMLLSLVTLFVGLLIGSFGLDLLQRYAGGVVGNSYVAYGLSVTASLAAVFVFLVSVYYLLTNVEHSFVDVLPGAVVAAVVLEASFQALPVYVRFSNNVVALKAFGGPALLLVWLYVMANVIVFGAEVNWRFAQRRGTVTGVEEGAGLA
jgi:membrane protein